MSLPAGVDPDRLSTWVLLVHTHGAVFEAVGRDLEHETGLGLSWHEVLLRLAHAPAGGKRMQDLAQEVLLSKSGLSRLIDRMQGAGLVKRATCESDRRGTYAVLTGKGRTAFDRAQPVFLRSIEEHFSRHLTEADVRAMRAVCRAVLAGNGRSEEECVPPRLGREVPQAKSRLPR